MNFKEKILNWKPVFGDKNNKEIIRLRGMYKMAEKLGDEEGMDYYQKKLEFYIK